MTRQERLDAILAPWRSDDAPGFVAALRFPDKTIWRGAAGLASIGAATPLTPRSRLRIGSITKQFVTAIVFQLVAEGRLSLDTEAGEALGEAHAILAGLTVGDLLDHRSGLGDALTAHMIANGPAPTLLNRQAVFRLAMRQGSLLFPKHAGFSYSNTAFMVIEQIVERAEGAPLEAVITRRICEPLGLTRTSLVRSDLAPERGMADLHVPRGGGFARGIYPVPIGGEGGMVSTVDDMLEWLAALDEGDRFPGSVWAKMTTPVSLPGGVDSTFSYGVMRQQWSGMELLHHDGGVVGGVARAIKAPALGIDLVILANRSDVPLGAVTQSLLEAAADLPSTPPQVSVQLVPGAYARPASGRLYRITKGPDRLMLDRGGYPSPLLSTKDGWHFADSAELRHLRIRQDGEAALLVGDAGEPASIGRIEPNGEKIRPGHFAIPELEAQGVIEHDAMVLTGASGVHPHSLASLGPGVWEATSVYGSPFRPLIEADPAHDGDLLLSGHRLRHVRMRRTR